MTETESNAALEKVLDEIRNINHNVSQAFIFQDNKVIAKDKSALEDQTNKIIEHFETITGHANSIDGVESFTIQGSNGRLDIDRINDLYVSTVTSKEADPETINNLTHVLIPGIFKIIQTITPTNPAPMQIIETPMATLATKPEIKNNLSTMPELPRFSEIRDAALEYTELTVDDIGGLGALSSSPDIVRLDAITFGRWTEIFGENKNFSVSLKAASSRNIIECKSELSKDSKHQRNTVFLPELIQRKLNVKKGSKILVKPIFSEPKLRIENTIKPKTPVVPKEPIEEKIVPSPSENTETLVDYLLTEYSEFTVGDMGKLGIISGNTVRLHLIAVGHWRETYGVTKIQNVMLKDQISGVTVTCKCETTKDPKHDRQSVRIPDQLQRKLKTKKGSTILIKPIIKNEVSNEELAAETSKLQTNAKSGELQSTKPNIAETSENLSATTLPSPDSSNCQLMVEDVSGFNGLREQDIVRFDKAVALRWKELYGERNIEEVTILDPNLGKSVKNKFKIAGGPKLEGKGLIQLPKSVQKQLSVKPGSLVILKPVLD